MNDANSLDNAWRAEVLRRYTQPNGNTECDDENRPEPGLRHKSLGNVSKEKTYHGIGRPASVNRACSFACEKDSPQSKEPGM
jgi:hypothetical protein